MCEALIGDAKGEHVVLRVLAREFPESDDVWDGNWLVAEIDVVAGAFRGHVVDCFLRTENFAGFHRRIGELHNGLVKEAAFSTMEEWLTLRIAKDEAGRLNLVADLTDAAGRAGNLLRFRFPVEEQQLTPLLEELATILARFPSRGGGE